MEPQNKATKPTNMVRVVEWTKKGRLMSNWNQCLTIWRDKSDAPVCIRCINLVSSWGTSVSRVTNVEKGAYWSCLTKFLRRDLMESRNDSAQHWIYEWQLHFMFERYVYVYIYIHINYMNILELPYFLESNKSMATASSLDPIMFSTGGWHKSFGMYSPSANCQKMCLNSSAVLWELQ